MDTHVRTRLHAHGGARVGARTRALYLCTNTLVRALRMLNAKSITRFLSRYDVHVDGRFDRGNFAVSTFPIIISGRVVLVIDLDSWELFSKRRGRK